MAKVKKSSKKVEVKSPKKPGTIQKMSTVADESHGATQKASPIGMNHGQIISDFLDKAYQAMQTFAPPVAVSGELMSSAVAAEPQTAASISDLILLHKEGHITSDEIRGCIGLPPKHVDNEPENVQEAPFERIPTDAYDAAYAAKDAEVEVKA